MEKPSAASTTSALRPRPSAPLSASSSASRPPVPSWDAYPWLSDATLTAPAPVDSLEHRFAAPSGFTRIALAPESFGTWLRRLPLAKADHPVLTYRGDLLHPHDHPHIASVVAIDIGKADLQQCADAVIRLHAEWLWSRGIRTMSYQAASQVAMPWERWARGERPVSKGASLVWESKATRAPADHAAFRKYLDSVFMFANTVALSRQASAVPLEDMRPGDFVVQGGNPGHAVLILDMATGAHGKKALLLGQSYMPAQSFQVLRPNPHQVWFEVDPNDGLSTPFWRKFAWTELRRLP